MIFTQVTLLAETKVKKANGAERSEVVEWVLPAKRERVIQSRIDENSMQGLSKNYRFRLDNIGELENLIFQYFLDENGVRMTTTTWERDIKNNELILEGRKANDL